MPSGIRHELPMASANNTLAMAALHYFALLRLMNHNATSANRLRIRCATVARLAALVVVHHLIKGERAWSNIRDLDAELVWLDRSG